MLVLTRKLNESILIGGDILITITKIKGGKVLLGIEAPRNVQIVRSETVDREESDGDDGQ